MDISDITYEEEFNWKPSVESIVFIANTNNKRIKCSISRAALNDCYKTEDTKEKALENFNENKGAIFNIANKLIEQERFTEVGEIFISSRDFN